MAETDAGGTVGTVGVRRHLPRRDLIVIPLLMLGTALVLFATAEITARTLWPSHHSTGCFVMDEQLKAAHSIPNCSTEDKTPEGPWLTYTYNECGYRTPDPCGPKPPGDLRVVFLGSSITQGYHVPFEKTYANLVSQALAAATHRPVQNENLGYEGLSPLQIYRKVPEALALHPDLVIFAITPFDLEVKTDPEQLAARNDPTARFNRPAVTVNISPLKRLGNMAQASRTALMAQHFLYSNTNAYLRLSLSRGDKTDYLRTPMSPAWQSRFDDFGLLLGEIAGRFRDAGIPFVVVFVPSHQIAALLSGTERPPQTDAFEFSRAVQAVTTKLGLPYVDGTAAMRNDPHSDRFFYLAESHLNVEGHAVIAGALMKQLNTGFVPTHALQGH